MSAMARPSPIRLIPLTPLLVLSLSLGERPASAESARVSVKGRYLVSIRPPSSPVRVNEWQEWVIHVARRDRAPLALRQVALDGGMPAHGHGLPTAPTVSASGAPGAFTASGVRFHMAGRWEVRVLVADREGADAATFPIDVAAGRATAPDSGVPDWTAEERAAFRSLWIENLGPVPADPSNRVADDPRAVALGHRLFFDAGLSGNGKIACATCHQPGKHFADRRIRGRGVAGLERNTPSLVGAGHARWFYWDGRRDSAWSQALAPIEAPAEMNGSRVQALLHVHRDYRTEYEALFGRLPDLSGVPRRASPQGDGAARAAWSSLSPRRQEAINRAFANLGKAIAAYERVLVPGVSAFDRYVRAVEAGDGTAAARELGPRAVAGLKIFLSEDAQCLRCHNGPLFTNGEFHNIGTGAPARPADRPDFGRSIGIQAVLATEFNCLGPHGDDPRRACPELRFLNRHEQNGSMVGAYKVPSLRNAALTGPYMHDGRFATLAETIGHYRRPPPSSAPIEFRPLFDMSPQHIDAIAAFLETLSAPVAAPAHLLRPPRL
jgi:cytochrome c peroxidase